MNLIDKLMPLKKRYQKRFQTPEASSVRDFVGPTQQAIKQARFTFQIGFGSAPQVIVLGHTEANALLQELNISLKGVPTELVHLPYEFEGMRLEECDEPGIRAMAEGTWSEDPANVGARTAAKFQGD